MHGSRPLPLRRRLAPFNRTKHSSKRKGKAVVDAAVVSPAVDLAVYLELHPTPPHTHNSGTPAVGAVIYLCITYTPYSVSFLNLSSPPQANDCLHASTWRNMWSH